MQAPATHQTWKKRWIMPMWGVQIPLLALSIIILAILIGIEYHGSEDSLGRSQSSVQAWTIANLTMAALAFLIVCLEISLYIHNDLSPKLYLGFNTFKFLTWIIPFAWNIHMNSTAWQERGWNNLYLWVAIGLSSAVFASLTASLAHALVVFRTYQQRAKVLLEKYSNSESSASDPDVFYR